MSQFVATIFAIVTGIIGLVLVLLQWILPIPAIESLIPPPSATSPISSSTDGHILLNTTALGRTVYRSIIGQPPPTNPNTILPRRSVVEDIYRKLTALSDISVIALFGLNNIGKSTLAALTYFLAEDRYRADTTKLGARPLWLKIDSEVTIADLAGTLCEAYGVTIPNFENLSPSNKAVALLDILCLEDKARMIILDHLDSLLDGQLGYVKPDRPGIQEFLDAINGKQLSSRILITSRLLPKLTNEIPLIYMQEYRIEGLNPIEGVELLQHQPLNVTDITQLSAVVNRCEGHIGALIGISSLLHLDKSLSIPGLLKDPRNVFRWGTLAYNLLRDTYPQLKREQHELLLAFAIYHREIPLQAAELLITDHNFTQILEAFDVLLTLNLILPTGNGYYRLPTIVGDCALYHPNKNDGEVNRHHYICTLHDQAARYYQDVARVTCPAPGQRSKLQDLYPLLEAHQQFCQAEKWQDAYKLMIEEDIISDLKKLKEYEILRDLFQNLFPLENWRPTNVQKTEISRDFREIQKVLGENQ